MAEIYRTSNFILESHERPEVDRNDGDPIKHGHKDEYQPLTQEDCQLIANKIDELFTQKKFLDEEWKI